MQAEARHDTLHEGAMLARQCLGCEERLLRVTKVRQTARLGVPLALGLAVLFLGQQRFLRPQHEVAILGAHDAWPDAFALGEDVGEVEPDLACDRARAREMTVDLRTREMRVAGIPGLQGVARLLEQPGQVDPQRGGDPLDIRAQDDAIHAPHPHKRNI